MASEFLNLRQGVALPEGSPVVVECLKALERKCMYLEDRCAKLESELHGIREPEATSVSDNAKVED